MFLNYRRKKLILEQKENTLSATLGSEMILKGILMEVVKR